MTAVAEPYAAAERLERLLGDPRDPDNPCGFEAAARRAAAEEPPDELIDRVGSWLRAGYVPARDGGGLVTMDRTLMQVRCAARRDASVMPATMFSITAAYCVLVAGSPAQRERVVRILRAGGAIGFALSEETHGSDLLANSVTAAGDGRADAPFVLDGEKWLVGLGTRCEALLVVARTGGRGPGAFSALLLDGPEVDKARCERRQYPTGMRGADFGGFAFDGLPVARDALVGARGRGLETAMKAMQVVRTMSTAANLACADTGLRLALDFASDHLVSGQRALTLPHPRRELATAAALLFAGDVVAMASARGVHALPAAQSLWSSVAKKVLSDTSQEVFHRCADVLGSRSVLRQGPYAAFDVARRDNAVVRYIDTSPVANNRLVVSQLARLASAAKHAGTCPEAGPGTDDVAGWEDSALARVFSIDASLPDLEPTALDMTDRGSDVVFDALPCIAAAVRDALPAMPGTTVGEQARLAALTRQVESSVCGLLHQLVWRLSKPREAVQPLEENDLADRLTFLHAAAQCLLMWWFNRRRSLFGLPAGSTAWLTPVLTVLLERAYARSTALAEGNTESALKAVEPLYLDNRMFSCAALRLAGPSAADEC